MERARAGEHAAFDALFGRYAPVVAEEARRHGLHGAVGDIIQETFVRVYQRLWELQDPARFAPWLRSIARRVCLGELRTRTRAQRDTGWEAERRRAAPVDRQALYDVLRRLPLEDREPLRLHYLLDLDTNAAARIMGIGTGTFRVRLHRARARARRLAASLQREEMIAMSGRTTQEAAQQFLTEAYEAIQARPERFDWPRARDRFTEARQTDPECYEASYWLGRKLAKDGEWKEAIKVLTPLWEQAEEEPWVPLTLAWCYDYLGQRGEALQWYARVVALPYLTDTQQRAARVGVEVPQRPKAFPKIPAGVQELPHTGWTARASHETVSPLYAIDGDASTRWTPMGGGQEPTEWLRLDLGAEAPIAGLWLDDDAAGQAPTQNDQPRHCFISVSRDGEWWKRVGEWRWRPNLYLEAWWEPISARFVLLEQIARHTPEWWSVFEAHIYRGG